VGPGRAGVKIRRVEAFPVSLERDRAQARGTAGSPTALTGAGNVRWSTSVATVYSPRFETALVRVTLDDGRVGWGEAQAPVAPRVACAIVEDILKPVLEDGPEFDGSRECIEHLWSQMFQTMRVRGQTGGFMLDAMAGVDIALWDLAGQLAGRPVAAMLGSTVERVPAYLSGLAGADTASRVEFARRYFDQGFRTFKVFYDGEPAALLELLDALRAELGTSARIAVDALWRLEWPASRGFLDELALRDLLWLEAPFQPDLAEAHREFARAYDRALPMALGESYRTRREMSWFLDNALVKFAQPDLGRSGITETLRIAAAGVPVVPHVSIAMGPQVAAAIHTAAALGALCEFNPAVLEMANRYLDHPLAVRDAAYDVPRAPGLGLAWGPPAADLFRQ